MDYIKTARPRAWRSAGSCGKHAFRNACIPVITVLGLQFGQLLGGAIITETVFAWPGVATLTVDSIRNQDFPVVQCAVVLLALIIVVMNLDRGHGRGLHRPTHPGGRMTVAARRRRRPRRDSPRRPRPSAAARFSGGSRAFNGGLPPPSCCSLIVLSAVLAPWISPHDPLAVDIRHRLAPPAWMAGGKPDHRLGTDQVGRDLLSRVIYGGRISLIVGVSAVILSASIGVLAGARRGLLRRRARLDHHDGDQHHADLSVRAPRPRGDRGARPQPAQHDRGARGRRLAHLRTGLRGPRRMALREREFVDRRARAGHEPRAPHLPPDPAEPGLGRSWSSPPSRSRR